MNASIPDISPISDIRYEKSNPIRSQYPKEPWFKLTHVRPTVDGNISLVQPWSSKDNVIHIHGHDITLNFILVETEVNCNKASLLDFQC